MSMICTGNSVVRVDDRLEPAPGETATSVSGLVAAGVWVIGLVIGLIALGIGQVGIASTTLGVAIVAPWLGLAAASRSRRTPVRVRA
ncbi:conserved hypothetical membrane protein [Mycobacterium ulcerans Agy99]|uniref:Conserved hypothetical membrane protein n=2 Tax=Mycobacterium ulcerans TaxID=1809 RepID=A0PVC1_MYCUA|nr:conserved hypothetical membrane protein [Mycobacterium ulcerans Agy99]